MKTSRDRILTTHVGSLPRPPELRQILVRKDQGEPYDKNELMRVGGDAIITGDAHDRPKAGCRSERQ